MNGVGGPPAADAKGRARAKVVAHLEQHKQRLTAHIEGKAFEATRPVYRTNDAGERVRVTQPVHVRRDWFEDGAGSTRTSYVVMRPRRQVLVE